MLNLSSAVFQAGGLIVVLVEVFRKAYLAAIVPVIVNTILNEHQVVVDIVAFVGKGDFPRSRLGEKQRGKILASWVTRKMRTIAQFSIRDPDASDVTMNPVPEDRAVTIQGSPGLNERPVSMTQRQQDQATKRFSAAFDPNYATNQNLPYESSIVESPPTDGLSPYEDKTPKNSMPEYFPPTISPPTQDEGFSTKDYFDQPTTNHDPEQTPLAKPANQQYSNNGYGGGGYSYSSAPTYSQPQQQQEKSPIVQHQQLPPLQSQSQSTNFSAPRKFNNGAFASYHPGVASSNGALSKVRPPPEPPKNAFLRSPSGRGGLRVINPATANPEDEEPWPQETINAIKRYGS